jgi:hypothetical protein
VHWEGGSANAGSGGREGADLWRGIPWGCQTNQTWSMPRGAYNVRCAERGTGAAKPTVTTRYRLLHYANLIRRTGPICFPFNLLNLATPLLSYAVHLVLLILVPLSSLPCYLYDAVLILTSDILYSLIDTFLSILRYISTHVFVVKP